MGDIFASAGGGGVGRVTFSKVYLFIFTPFYNGGGVGGVYICLCLRGIVGNIVYSLSIYCSDHLIIYSLTVFPYFRMKLS